MNSDVSGVVVIIQNIDLEKQLDLQKELFLATLTHDLKTPLQAQISSLQLLAKGSFGQVNSSQKEIIDMVIESSDFMREMLYSILFTYKYENGLMRLDKQNFNIDNLIKICMREALYLAKDKNVEIDYKNFAENNIVNGDESQIRRVIANILNNAVNYAYKNTKIIIYICNNNLCIFIRIINCII